MALGRLQTNCYLLWDSRSKDAWAIDPGGQAERIVNAASERRLTLKGIFNTHGHADHIGGNGGVQAATGAPIGIHADDQEMLTDADLNLSHSWGLEIKSPPAARLLAHGEALALGSLSFRVIATPGHSPGSICLLGHGWLFSGDTLFAGSVGRTDIPGGDYALLRDSLRERLMVLPPETRVFPGHGPETTIGNERIQNPFLQAWL